MQMHQERKEACARSRTPHRPENPGLVTHVPVPDPSLSFLNYQKSGEWLPGVWELQGGGALGRLVMEPALRSGTKP